MNGTPPDCGCPPVEVAHAGLGCRSLREAPLQEGRTARAHRRSARRSGVALVKAALGTRTFETEEGLALCAALLIHSDAESLKPLEPRGASEPLLAVVLAAHGMKVRDLEAERAGFGAAIAADPSTTVHAGCSPTGCSNRATHAASSSRPSCKGWRPPRRSSNASRGRVLGSIASIASYPLHRHQVVGGLQAGDLPVLLDSPFASQIQGIGLRKVLKAEERDLWDQVARFDNLRFLCF